MEKNNLCPKCGSDHIEHIQMDMSTRKNCGYRIDFEVHPFLYRCPDCGEVFPGDGFPLPDLPDEV